MQQEQEDILEQSRNEKIKALGFLCYNLYIDGVMAFPEMNEAVGDIKRTLNCLLMLRQDDTDTNDLHMQEDGLNDKLTELGCICYNLYVDSKLFNNKVLSLCNSISSINYEIADGLKTFSQEEYPSSREKYPSSQEEYPNSYEELQKPITERRNVTQSKLKVTYPYGMEPIPVNYKQCVCGYRNKSEARFCGKCGAKLS